MVDFTDFSPRIALPHIPAGPGVVLIEDEAGQVLKILATNNVRRRIGELLDSDGKLCVHGPRAYALQQAGQQVYVRWKHTENYKLEKRRLVSMLEKDAPAGAIWPTTDKDDDGWSWR